MVKLAEDAAKHEQKIQSMQLPDDRHRWAAEKAGVRQPELSPEEMAARHSDMKKIIKEIGEMRAKLDTLNADKNSETTTKSTTTTKKPPDIHITIPPKDKTE